MARENWPGTTQPMHDFDCQTDFCTRCGIALYKFVDRRGPLICPDNDRLTNLKACHQIDALVRPVLELMGEIEPEVKH